MLQSGNVATSILFVVGVFLLISGAEILVRGASRLASAVGISPLVIGLTIVAFGTSSAEFSVCARAALSGQSSLAFGSMVGSNIFNILFTLGVSALIAPLAVSRQVLRWDVSVLIGSSVLLLVLSLDGKVSRWDAAVLLMGIVTYTIFAVRRGRKQGATTKAGQTQGIKEEKHEALAGIGLRAIAVQVSFILAGLAMLVFGSRWMVDGAIAVAHSFGLSELVVGLTIVAAGTSLPELATSIIAALRGQNKIAVGNIVGSNIANILFGLGLTGIIAPGGIAVPVPALKFYIPVMIAAAIICLPVFFIDRMITRWEGALFLSYYAAFVLYLILETTHRDAWLAYISIMAIVVIPLTTVMLSVLTIREARASNRLNAPPVT